MEYRRALPEQYEAFLSLMRDQAAAYLERTMALMDMTWEQFSALFRTVGQVCGVYEDGALAGFYWIEKRDAVLHLHTLILKEQFRGRGIGTQVLAELEERHCAGADAIELGVHDSNRLARALYERLGFETVKRLDELEFEVMRKHLPGERLEST